MEMAVTLSDFELIDSDASVHNAMLKIIVILLCN